MARVQTSDAAPAPPSFDGRVALRAALAPYTWFRVGGAAEVLYSPTDSDALADALRAWDGPVLPVGVGSNLLVRDGGISGLTVRLGRGFAGIAVAGDTIRAGAAVPDAKLAQAAQRAGLAGLEFYRGIPGTVGGAVRMNAGCHGTETRDRLVEATVVFRDGTIRTLTNAELGFAYRHCALPGDAVVTEALFRGTPDDPDAIAARMADLMTAREAAQPVREKTGGSTFRNPEGESAWRLIDAAGCRGLRIGGAQVSEKHCNFLVNHGDATAADLEALGETVRTRVLAASGHDLHWEIRRVGRVGEEPSA